MKCRLTRRRVHWKAIQCSKSIVIEIVVLHDHQIAVAHLSHEVKSLGIVKRTHDRRPIASVGINRPDTPESLSPKSLAFVTAEREPAVLQWRWMQCAADSHRRNRCHVLAVLVHHEQLQRRSRVILGWNKAVSIANERYFAAG